MSKTWRDFRGLYEEDAEKPKILKGQSAAALFDNTEFLD